MVIAMVVEDVKSLNEGQSPKAKRLGMNQMLQPLMMRLNALFETARMGFLGNPHQGLQTTMGKIRRLKGVRMIQDHLNEVFHAHGVHNLSRCSISNFRTLPSLWERLN